MKARLFPTLLLQAALILPVLAEGPIVLLIGTPAAGKTTQAEILRRDLGMTVISADDLIARNKERFVRYKTPTLTGVEPRLDPALNSLVEDALRAADRTKGIVLDGYPASAVHGDFLVSLRKKMNLPKALVIHLQIPDDVARKRLKQQKEGNIEQQLKDYHREFDFAKTYFPQTDIRTVDGTQSTQAVAAQIRKMIEARSSSGN
jgi:adenylate kinase family enzyme